MHMSTQLRQSHENVDLVDKEQQNANDQLERLQAPNQPI